MPSNHLLKDLPFVDEDGYFEGVCSVQMGGGISLPANVAEAAVPEDTEHFFYKLNATRDGFDAEKKPTTAAECVACGVISHESQTAHCSELRELFQKLTEGSSEYHVVRGKPALLNVPADPIEVVPSTKRFAKFGKLKVVLPSPLPCFVPITAKSAAYVDRLTAAPLQRSQPSGTE